MDVGGRLSGVDREHLIKAPDGLLVRPLAPGDVAEPAQALDIAGVAGERVEGVLLVTGAYAERELDALVIGIKLERLPILTSSRLQVAPPVGQVAAEDIAGDPAVRRKLRSRALPPARGVGAGKDEQRSWVVGEAGQLGEVFLNGV